MLGLGGGSKQTHRLFCGKNRKNVLYFYCLGDKISKMVLFFKRVGVKICKFDKFFRTFASVFVLRAAEVAKSVVEVNLRTILYKL